MKNEDKETIKYSIIVIHDEVVQDFSQFIQSLYEIFTLKQETFEIIIIANGTEGFVKKELLNLTNCFDKIKTFVLNKKTSQAVCLKAGLKESKGEIIVACGSYQQITKDSFIDLLDSFDDETDIISPWRQDRYDPTFNQFQSKVFNIFVRIITGSNLNDLSCSIKIFRRNVMENIEIYGNMYRFLPILAAQKGYIKKEVKCKHYPQKNGRTGFYTLPEYFSRIIDIFTLYFNTRFTRKPLRFFSAIGSSFIAIGFLISLYIFMQKFIMGYPIGGRPILLLSILFLVLGVQAASVGLLGEIIAFTHGRLIIEYSIEEEI